MDKHSFIKKIKSIIKGFTLIELMAVLLIVIVISLIAAPTIFNVVETSKRESFLVNARQILRIVDNEKLSNSTFDLSQINPETMMDLIDIPGEYYESITFKEYNDNLFINVSVADRWKGLSACGSYNSLTVVKGKCELDNEAPRITFNPNGSTSYIKSSNVEVSVVDSFLDEESLKYVWTTTEEEPLVEEYVNIFKNMSNIPMPDGNGSFFLHVIAKDTLDNIAKEYRGFLLDNEAPVITVNGDINITINKGTAYVDLGATAIDNADGDLTSRIVTTGTVNPNMLGTYTITYTVSDNSGNIATKTRTVNVVDTVGPVITFGTNGNSTYAKSRSTTVTVTDSYSSIDTSNLKYLWSTESTGITETNIQALFTNGVNLTSPSEQTGIYYLWILAKDSAGNTTVARSNAFYLDNTKPVITLSGSSTINVNVGTTYTDAGATASDEHSGLNGNINVTNTVNTSIVGTYTITYNISDKAGNAAVQVTRTVNVIDNVAPTIVFGTNGNSTYAKNRSTTVTVSDAHSTVNTSSLKYLWNTSTTAPSEGSFGTSFTNDGTVNSPAATTGIYYLWILAKDSVGNTNIQDLMLST